MTEQSIMDGKRMRAPGPASRAIMVNGKRAVQVGWAPSHQDDDYAELVIPVFRHGLSFVAPLLRLRLKPLG
eukprot:1194203-Pyramimonas_sp.AAC.1